MKKKVKKFFKTYKKRIITILVIILVGVLLSGVAAFNVNEFFSKSKQYSINIITAFRGLSEPRPLIIFCCLVGFVLLGVFFIVYASTSINYKSDMYQVTPDIEIPCPVGQGQYGTSWFISQKNLSQYFTKVDIDDESTKIKSLLKQGAEDYDAIEKKYAAEIAKERSKG